MASPTASVTLNRLEAAMFWPCVAVKFAAVAVTTGSRSTGALTLNLVQEPYAMPSLARTQRLAEPEPDWKVALASCAAVTLMAILAPCATPPTTQCPLEGDVVESKNW